MKIHLISTTYNQNFWKTPTGKRMSLFYKLLETIAHVRLSNLCLRVCYKMQQVKVGSRVSIKGHELCLRLFRIKIKVTGYWLYK